MLTASLTREMSVEGGTVDLELADGVEVLVEGWLDGLDLPLAGELELGEPDQQLLRVELCVVFCVHYGDLYLAVVQLVVELDVVVGQLHVDLVQADQTAEVVLGDVAVQQQVVLL